MKTKITLNQTHHTIGDFDSIFQTLTKSLNKDGLHLFPELFLTGYPLNDLVLQRSFITGYLTHLEDINHWAKKEKGNWKALIGGVHYDFFNEEYPVKIQNVIYELSPGEGLKVVYVKQLLPNYDIFDEQKYFTAGNEISIFDFQGEKFALQICEDMWPSSIYQKNPIASLYDYVEKNNVELAGIINLSASPFEVGKMNKRLEQAESISCLFGVPFIYVNRVGAEDEIIFDGRSFVQNGEDTILELKALEEDFGSPDLSMPPVKRQGTPKEIPNTWEALFKPRLEKNEGPIKLVPLSDEDCKEILEALIFGVQDYARKSGFKKFLVALSGGMDSVLVLTILKLSLKPGQSLEAVYMPSMFSSALSTELSEDLCKRLGVPLSYFPIKFLHSAVKNAFTQSFPEPFTGLVDENVQSRLRGTLLYTRSNQTGSMVVNTSNKSEIAVGYSTQYGDSVGAISLLGDLYKSEVYRLSHYINKFHNNIIPNGVIDRGPSAELRENQLDLDSLPPYERLDAILEGLLSYRMGEKELLQNGHDSKEITRVIQLLSRSEYKRRQFCPILKVKSKSFGFGYRMPMSKQINY